MLTRTFVFLTGVVGGVAALATWLYPRPHVPDSSLWLDRSAWTATDQQSVAAIDAEFARAWSDAGLQPADPADELVVVRRLSLALTGTVPSLEELRALEQLPADERIEAWTDYLLQDRRHADYFAERLARSLVGVQDGPFLVFRRRRFVHWLSEQLHENRPYDAIVRDLLTDEGLWTDSPAVNFVTATLDQNADNQPDPIKLAARTSRAFLGLRIDCLQCHDDNLGTIDLGDAAALRGGTQEDFHQLASFFGNVRSTLRGIRDEQPERMTDYQVKYLDAETETAVPRLVPYRQDLVSDDPIPRRALADWVTHPENQPFARAIVNRVWALMTGRPLTESVDDIELYGPFPAGLDALAADLVRRDYDLRHLIRTIARTRAFRTDSRAAFEITEEHERLWAVFPVTRLRPEQIAGGIIQASSLRTINGQAGVFARLTRFGQENEFVDRFGDLGEDEFNMTGGTIPQRLLLMNGELVGERTRSSDLILNASAQVALLAPDDRSAVETAYLITLTRRPTDEERAAFERRLEGTSGDERRRVVEDLIWVLVNGSEFFWNH
ncbi:MAG TPA: DUF1553 domain-containing protein [Pirellulaceae bacterium]|nr:DUF1553 domain-containing protein [Pirellulaceae bacterium]